MITIFLIIHVFIVAALVGVVLMQRSEGGALGSIGGGGPGGGFMSSRSAATALTRTTSILAALFFASSIGLAIFADNGQENTGLFGNDSVPASTGTPGEFSGDDILQGFDFDDAAEEEGDEATGQDDLLEGFGDTDDAAEGTPPVETSDEEEPAEEPEQ